MHVTQQEFSFESVGSPERTGSFVSISQGYGACLEEVAFLLEISGQSLSFWQFSVSSLHAFITVS